MAAFREAMVVAKGKGGTEGDVRTGEGRPRWLCSAVLCVAWRSNCDRSVARWAVAAQQTSGAGEKKREGGDGGPYGGGYARRRRGRRLWRMGFAQLGFHGWITLVVLYEVVNSNKGVSGNIANGEHLDEEYTWYNIFYIWVKTSPSNISRRRHVWSELDKDEPHQKRTQSSPSIWLRCN